MHMALRLSPLLLALVACGDDGGGETTGSSGAATDPATSFASTTAPTGASTSEPDPTTPTTGGGETDPTAPGTTGSSETTGSTGSSETTASTGGTAGDATSTGDGSSTGSTGGPVCGDGVVEGDEGCDDGPNNGAAAACHDDCQPDVCGDGQVGPNEQCDDGNQIPDDACNDQCSFSGCGDGVLAPGEPCDDGKNGDADDGCTDLCALPACGDGLLQPLSNGEGCDDGPANDDAAACTSACELAQCGDGLVWAGEEACDDGNANDLDDCSNMCVAASCMDDLQNGGELGVDCGGPDCGACPFVLMLGGNASKLVGARFDGANWTTTDIAAPAVDPIGLTIAGDDVGIGVFRYTKLNDPKDRQLQFVRHDGGWGAPGPIGDNTTRAAPSISADGPGAHVVFHGENFQFYYAHHDGAAWSPVSEPIGSFGPGPGSVATLAGEAAFVFHDGAQNNNLSSRLRAPPWQPQQTLDTAGSYDTTPRVVALTAGAELLTVFVRNSDDALRFTRRSAGVWSAAAAIPGASTPQPPALAALPGGAAIVAFRGLDERIYTASYDAVGNTWSAVSTIDANVTSASPPAVARGIGAADVELVYLEKASKAPRHVRRIGGAWTMALPVSATGLDNVALASRP